MWHYHASDWIRGARHAVACAALSSHQRTADDRGRFRRNRLSGAAAAAPAGAPLYAAHSVGDARSHSDHAAARHATRKRASFAQKHGAWIAARLDRLPEPVPFAHDVVVPLRGVPHRIAHRHGTRGTVWTEIDGNGERLLCVAGHAPHIDRRIGDFLRREARARPRGHQPALCPRSRRRGPARHRARPVEPLGLLLDHRHAVVFLAAYPGAEPSARLPRRARSRPSRRNEPLRQVLARGATDLPAS